MLQHQKIIERAKVWGISVEDVSGTMRKPAAILEWGGVSELAVNGIPCSWMTARSQLYCDNKQLAKRCFQSLGIPSPRSILFNRDDLGVVSDFMRSGGQYVCKPLDGSDGRGVEMGIHSLSRVVDYLNKNTEGNCFLLEEQISGGDLRIHVIGGKIVAACIREPAYVIGNGEDSLNTLIEKRRAVMAVQNPNNSLLINDSTKSLLSEQRISLEDVVSNATKIQLKKISNMASGGIATDVTDEIHPDYHKWISRLVAYLGTGYLGVDFITHDHQAPPQTHSQLLELNAHADWLHHTFSERRTHDIAGMILREVFKGLP